MISKFFGEKKKDNNALISDTSITGINNSKTPYNGVQSALVKLKVDDNEIDKNAEITESVIDKIERKINNIKNPELFTRENQLSRAVDEIIEVPKIKIKDESNILSEDKKQNQLKKKLREEENEQDKEKRKIENDNEIKMKKKYLEKFNVYKLKIKKENIKIAMKYIFLFLLIGAAIIFLIIFLDKL